MKTHRICLYRECDEPVPFSRRSDAKYCSDQCGINERNARKTDNPEKIAIEKKLHSMYKFVEEAYNSGKIVIPVSVLIFHDFDFTLMTGYDGEDRDTATINYKLYDFELCIDKINCVITKL